MSPEYPYQIVAFLHDEPSIGEGIYKGKNGWYSQIALKRRFATPGINESNLLLLLDEFATNTPELRLHTGQLIKPNRMPVQVIDILNGEEIKRFHLAFIHFMGSCIKSRYSERDGLNYFPHVTAEYGGTFVLDANQFANQTFAIDKICLIKDGIDTDSHVIAYFDLKED